MFPPHVQKVVDAAEGVSKKLRTFSDEELQEAYWGLGRTSGASFGMKIKGEIDRRHHTKRLCRDVLMVILGAVVAFSLQYYFTK